MKGEIFSQLLEKRVCSDSGQGKDAPQQLEGQVHAAAPLGTRQAQDGCTYALCIRCWQAHHQLPRLLCQVRQAGRQRPLEARA